MSLVVMNDGDSSLLLLLLLLRATASSTRLSRARHIVYSYKYSTVNILSNYQSSQVDALDWLRLALMPDDDDDPSFESIQYAMSKD